MPKDIKLSFESLPDDSTIYCTMYGLSNENDKIMNIKKSDIYAFDDDKFFYVWGWPGPDYNTYRFSDYGKTWAFSVNDFK